MGTYLRTTAEDKFRLKTILDPRLSQSQSVEKVGFNKSAVSRELARKK